MRTVSLFLYKFHFKIVAFVLRVRTRLDGPVREFLFFIYCRLFFFFSFFRFSCCFRWFAWFWSQTAAKYLDYFRLYTCVCVCVRLLSLIGFRFMSPGWCNAFNYYSRSSSSLVAVIVHFQIEFLTKVTTRCEFGQSHRTRITHYFHQNNRSQNLYGNKTPRFVNIRCIVKLIETRWMSNAIGRLNS